MNKKLCDFAFLEKSCLLAADYITLTLITCFVSIYLIYIFVRISHDEVFIRLYFEYRRQENSV